MADSPLEAISEALDKMAEADCSCGVAPYSSCSYCSLFEKIRSELVVAEQRLAQQAAALAEARDEIIHYGRMVPFNRRDYGPMLVKIDNLVGPKAARNE